jgi:glycosyltransferase involved in cell wall biosynthesis
VEISIIIPSYNYGRYLTDSIRSLVGGPTSLGEFAPQTFRDFDITIVDDASTDETYQFAKQLLDANIHYINNPENVGTAAALNIGIRQATGRYITFLSADDMMETTRLEKMYRAAVANPHRVVYDDLAAFKDGYRTDKLPMPAYDFDRLLYKNTMAAGILYPRAAWQEVGGYPEQFRDGREDWAFNVLLGSVGYCGVHVKEPLYLYRREGQNRSLHNGGAEGRIKWLQKMRDAFPALYRGERTMACCGARKVARSDKSTSSRSTPARNSSSPRAVVDLRVGIEGMVLLEFQLNKAGYVMYTGSVTGQQYAFGGSHKRGYVDARDAPALLDRYESRRHVFAVVDTTPEPAPAPPPPAPVPVIETQVIKIQTDDAVKKPKKAK